MRGASSRVNNKIFVASRKGDALIARRLTVASRRLLTTLMIHSSSLEIFLLGGEEMNRLKRTFYPKGSGLANVLAFPPPPNFPDPEARLRSLGQIYVNRDLCRKDYPYLAFLLLHGLLHLLGYEHVGKSDILKMEKREKELWQTMRITSSRGEQELFPGTRGARN